MNDNLSELEKLNTIMIKYISALKVLETQLDIISDDFKYIKEYIKAKKQTKNIIFGLLKIKLIPNKFNKSIFAINTIFTLFKF